LEGAVKYQEFLRKKRLEAPATGIQNPPSTSPKLFGFQSDIVAWALRRGRAAIWADCGLGKGWMALEWARVVTEHTNKPVIILAPLAVSQQFAREAAKLGSKVTVCREDSDVRDGINVINYERLHKIDVERFVGVVADESSILKDYTSSTRNALINSFARTPFKLSCTATPAPNDHIELGNHAEFLGVMSRVEMLSMFFVHDGGSTQDWRLKGHAKKEFWKWISSWAVNIRAPSDLGYSDDGFKLPPLSIHEHIVETDNEMARNAGMLFAFEARDLSEQRAARRGSLDARVKLAADIINATDEPWLVWCDLNAESEALTKAINGAVQVQGSDDADVKESRLLGFADKNHRVLVTKPSIAGHGLNFQHCAHTVFVGVSHSFEAWYQAIRRTYRFGQTRPVQCHVITSSAEGAVVANLKRKQADADVMATGMLAHMRDVQRENIRSTTRTFDEYKPTVTMTIPDWVGVDV
jgi:hypothetical protein